MTTDLHLSTIGEIVLDHASRAASSGTTTFAEASDLVDAWQEIRASYRRTQFIRAVWFGVTLGPVRRAARCALLRWMRRHP